MEDLSVPYTLITKSPRSVLFQDSNKKEVDDFVFNLVSKGVYESQELEILHSVPWKEKYLPYRSISK